MTTRAAMRVAVVPLGLLVVVGCWRTDSPAERSSREPIFRFVQTATDTIWLGTPLSGRINVPTGDTIVGLPPGSFGGAERIQVVIDSSRRVRAILFDYGRDADFEALVADYSSSLGAPDRHTVQRPGEEPAEVVVWRDARTEFRIIRDPNRSAWTVRSALRDRGLAGSGSS